MNEGDTATVSATASNETNLSSATSNGTIIPFFDSKSTAENVSDNFYLSMPKIL